MRRKTQTQSEEAMQEMDRHGVEPSYFHGHSFSSELIRGFFAAALAFRKIEPWREFGAEEWIDLDVAQLGLVNAAVTVIEDDGFGGLHIFPNRDTLDLAGIEEDEVRMREMGRGSLLVMFYARKRLPESLRGELRRLPFAPVTGPIPAVVALGDDSRRRPLTRRDYVLMTAVLTAATEFIDAYDGYVAETDYPVDVDGETIVVQLGLGEVEDEGEAPRAKGVEGSGPRPSEDSVHRLKVSLRGAKPAIWRRLEVPSTFTLEDMHAIMVFVMDWGTGRHSFMYKGRKIGPNDEKVDFDERTTELWAVLPEVGAVLRYTYDFGVSWNLDIEVEGVHTVEGGRRMPRCVDGRRAGPPEGCGGIHRFHALLARGSARREEDDAGLVYDPAAFSIEEINERFERVYRA